MSGVPLSAIPAADVVTPVPGVPAAKCDAVVFESVISTCPPKKLTFVTGVRTVCCVVLGRSLMAPAATSGGASVFPAEPARIWTTDPLELFGFCETFRKNSYWSSSSAARWPATLFSTA